MRAELNEKSVKGSVKQLDLGFVEGSSIEIFDGVCEKGGLKIFKRRIKFFELIVTTDG